MGKMMRRPLLSLALLLLLLLALAVATRPGVAQEDSPAGNRAALVLRLGEERVESRCVSFAEESISGYELLRRSGLDLEVQEVGMGVKLCRVDDVGCPAGNCFCECRGEPCTYWSYWHWNEGEWQYSVAGASSYAVSDGALEGWSWGPGTPSEAIAPPQLSFDDVCNAPAVAPTAVAQAAAETARQTPVASAAPALGEAATAAPAPEQGVAEEGAPALQWLLYVGFFLIFFLLLVAFVYLRGRQEDA